MFNTKRGENDTFVSERRLLEFLETLPNALLVIDDDATILYANATATTSVKVTKQEMLGQTFWQWFPRLISLEFYQALVKVLHTRKPLQVEYRSLVTSTWFYVHLSPGSAGIAVTIHEEGEPIVPQETFRQQEQVSLDILEGIPTSVVLLTPEGRVLNINQAPLTSAQLQRADVLGKPFAETFWWLDVSAAQQCVRAAIARASRGEAISFEARICTHAGGHSDRAATITPHLDGDGRVDYLIYTSNDITARKQAQGRLKELEQRKDDFLIIASHELKTPLTAVKIQTQLVRRRLVRQGLAEAAAELGSIDESIKRLERLIGELLDVSEIQAGKIEYLREPVDLDALLHEVAETMQQMNTTHTIVMRGATAHLLVGNKGWLKQVFINLISNAIKYSPDASTVEIEASASAESATIKVCDHGLGIPQEQREKIFECFYRVGDLSQKVAPGLGMELYIVAEIVKQHRGTITVESEAGKGSIFQVTLPLERPG